jgi:hypothetical protein
MRKFAANYLISDTGLFLKNGIVIVREDGLVVQYIDTKDDINEIEQLIFHNGVLMAGFKLTKANSENVNFDSDQPFKSLVLRAVVDSTQFSIQDLVDLGKQLQAQFPEMKIPAILDEITVTLRADGGFTKETIPGIYLLVGTDLAGLHFTSRSKLKKIM